MKRTWLAALITVLAVGCGPAPSEPVSENPASDLDISIPDSATADDDLTLVTLEVPGMT